MSARVLVVDDIPANVKLLEARLSAEYFDVVTAVNGADALTICERAECDVVLLDVMMPDMDGFEVCRRLKSNPVTHHIPVVMVTALDQLSDRVQGLEAGADDFLTKPVDDIALVTRVKNLARLKFLNDEMLMRRQESQQVARALTEIPPEQKQVLMLSFVEDMPQMEIARRLGLPLGTVKSRIRLALTRLRSLVAEAAP